MNKLLYSFLVYRLDEGSNLAIGIIAGKPGRESEWTVYPFYKSILFAEQELSLDINVEDFLSEVLSDALERPATNAWLVDLYFGRIGENPWITCPYYAYHPSAQTLAMAAEHYMNHNTYILDDEMTLDKFLEE